MHYLREPSISCTRFFMAKFKSYFHTQRTIPIFGVPSSGETADAFWICFHQRKTVKALHKNVFKPKDPLLPMTHRRKRTHSLFLLKCEVIGVKSHKQVFPFENMVEFDEFLIFNSSFDKYI